MVAISNLLPGQYPPDDEDFVLVSVARNGKVQITARFGDTGFRSNAVFEKDPVASTDRGMSIALAWAEELGLGLIYVEREVLPDA